jgi:hypothetical protein
VEEQVANSLFPSIVITASSMSGKAAYGEAVAKNDKHLYDKKILLVDEFKDLSDAAKATVKQMTSCNQTKLINKTMDEKRKYEEQEIEGMPAIWTNSMEVFQDIGSQIANRLFKANIDESVEQSNNVEKYQIWNEAFGDLVSSDSKVPLARAITEQIIGESDFIVKNLFSKFIRQKDNSKRNKRPMIHALVSAIAYANRYRRPVFNIGDKRVVFASLSDNYTALDIWHDNEQTQTKGIPLRHQKVLALLNPIDSGLGMTTGEIAAAFNLKYHPKKISSDTAYNYLKYLCEKDYATWVKERSRDDEEGKGRPEHKYFRI